jgi:hypothetical protein
VAMVRIYCHICDSYVDFLLIEAGQMLCPYCSAPLMWLDIMGPW